MVLFLDELTEFNKNVLENLWQPLEDGKVTISRAAMSLSYLARFMLAVALNPCPCGLLHRQPECSYLPDQIQKYMVKISGPRLTVSIFMLKYRHSLTTNSPANNRDRIQ